MTNLIVSADMLKHARALSGRTLLHVFASHRRFGGGWRNHSAAQEEYLFNNTPLRFQRLPEAAYPIDGEHGRCGFVVEESPTFGYAFVPAPVVGKRSAWTLTERAQRLATLAIGYDHLVTGAWGCGVFRNNPSIVAETLMHALESYSGTVHLCFTDDNLRRVFASVWATNV